MMLIKIWHLVYVNIIMKKIIDYITLLSEAILKQQNDSIKKCY